MLVENGENHFKVTLSSPRKFAKMSQRERVQACYQHSVIKYLSNSAMTNASLRERFKLSVKQRAMISMLIKDALLAKVIKLKDDNNRSTKYVEYLPHWA